MARIARLSERMPSGTGPLNTAALSCSQCLERRRILDIWLRLPVLSKKTDLEAYVASSHPGVHLQSSTDSVRAAGNYRPVLCSDVEGCDIPVSSCCSDGRSNFRQGTSPQALGNGVAQLPRCRNHACPNRLLLYHYLPFAPACMRRPVVQLFFHNIIVLLGAIRTERCQVLQKPASIEHVRAAVDAILQTKGDVRTCLKTLSRQVHLSTSYMTALFTSVVGIGFRQYVRSVRLTCAAARIITSETRISEISAEFGYKQPSNFVRDVRSGLDACPAHLRRLFSADGLVWACAVTPSGAERDDSRSPEPHRRQLL
jgi:AraC-like DNA-binding protein